MSDEYDNNNTYYSAFWPLVILLVGLILWLGYNVYEINLQRANFNQQYTQAIPTVGQAQIAQTRLVALMKDLVATSAKNQNATQVLQAAVAAGMIRVNQNPANAATNAPPADATPPAK